MAHVSQEIGFCLRTVFGYFNSLLYGFVAFHQLFLCYFDFTGFFKKQPVLLIFVVEIKADKS